ncbi:MAG TPA: PxKF domain-containing protein, partial [Anaerolineaceae bacterium]|nr:PxKF domain-containing protein [Anaerolineaceae bacterium]
LDIFASVSPTVQKVFCPITATKNVVEKYTTLATPPLSYNTAKDKYKFTWQTEAAWAGTCQLFTIELNDGTTHTALFKFK